MAGELLLEIGIALTAVALAGALAYRVGLSVIPAYILVGILVGPNEPSSVAGVSLTLVDHGEFIDAVAELGIVFLLFFLGLEFSVGQLLADRIRIAKIGSVDFAVNFGLGLVLGFAFGFSVVETLFLAGIVYISSSAVITKSLIDNGWVANPESGPILGTLVFEDILIAVYLALLSAVAFGGGSVTEAAASVGAAFGFLGALALVAWYGSGAIERLFSVDSDELFLLRVLGATTLVAGAALTAGLSEAVAAFFVGTAFSSTDHTERIENVVAPARDFFAAVFFFAIGLTTDVTLLANVAWLLVAALVVTTAGKLVSGTLSGRLYGLDATRSLRVGVGMVPRGEFSLIIAALAAGSGTGTLQSVIPAFTVGYVLVMSILGTVLIQNAEVLTGRFGDGWAGG
ncbi:cation:proton antiporter [Halorarum salinum]|uniref:Cation:proton antiporter n=1 Tax=Halorarum salinum TaxID=2743089 RepID=A0A7D5QGJ3_9EURY|nr:cation:proton antiporter [Halobaculum salinum]QLG61504.1 cation:proton antiporter [Halobaculum salinum]